MEMLKKASFGYPGKKKNDQVSSKGDLEKGLKLHVTVQLSNIMSQYLQSP